MKKIVILFVMFCFNFPAMAEIQPPRWEEFCPREYVNAEYIKDNTPSSIVNLLLAYSIIGFPFALHNINKSSLIESNNYWYNRRIEFEQKLNSCKNITNESQLIYQYLSIKQDELSKNANRKMNIMQAQQNAIAIQQNIQRSNLQSQINNIQTQNTFNQIQNNLRSY